jgi:hypothetical protein
LHKHENKSQSDNHCPSPNKVSRTPQGVRRGGPHLVRREHRERPRHLGLPANTRSLVIEPCHLTVMGPNRTHRRVQGPVTNLTAVITANEGENGVAVSILMPAHVYVPSWRRTGFGNAVACSSLSVSTPARSSTCTELLLTILWQQVSLLT